MAEFSHHALSGAPRKPRNEREMECPYCYGYGYRPRGSDADSPKSGPKAVRCYGCDGVGLINRSWR
ncbi:MAG: hypothetical protein KDK08_05445 [Rhizobiaceae bacterium]|nr:hypothetical protein [Rhizobiaceae bacterium]